MEESYGWAALMPNVVMRLHGPHVFGRETVEKTRSDVYRERAELRAIRKVRVTSSPSQSLNDTLFEEYGVAPDRVIPNPVPVPSRQWDMNNANLDQILFVGRIDRRKGADIALEAFSRAREQRPSLTMLMVGSGEPRPAPGVRFLGNLPPEELERLRLQSGLMLSASRFETFSYAIAESMALGMPVLSTPTFAEVIMNHTDGRIAFGQLHATLLEMLARPDRLAAMGSEARKTVKTRMSPEKIAKQTLDLYASRPSAYAARDSAGKSASEPCSESIEVVGACAG
jgi:glycosyltransferase involved in cell wall biosynthesis